MSGIITAGGGYPRRLDLFTLQAAEAALTMLFARYNLDILRLDEAMQEVKGRLASWLDDDAFKEPSPAVDPFRYGLDLAEDEFMRNLIYLPGPRGYDETVDATTILAAAISIAASVDAELTAESIEMARGMNERASGV